MYFDENNNYYDVSINFDRNNKLYSIEEGFNKGNLFQNLYSKYKNHIYKLNVNNKKDELLYQIQIHTFALKDLNLYLDVHPTDQSILLEFQKIKRNLEEAKSKYEKEYGPLCMNNTTNDDNWTWINNPWPWDKGGN